MSRRPKVKPLMPRYMRRNLYRVTDAMGKLDAGKIHRTRRARKAFARIVRHVKRLGVG